MQVECFLKFAKKKIVNHNKPDYYISRFVAYTIYIYMNGITDGSMLVSIGTSLTHLLVWNELNLFGLC